MMVAGLRVEEDDLVPLLLQRLAGLGPGVVELAGLADDDRPGAHNHDLLDVGAARHGERETSTLVWRGDTLAARKNPEERRAPRGGGGGSGAPRLRREAARRLLVAGGLDDLQQLLHLREPLGERADDLGAGNSTTVTSVSASSAGGPRAAERPPDAEERAALEPVSSTGPSAPRAERRRRAVAHDEEVRVRLVRRSPRPARRSTSWPTCRRSRRASGSSERNRMLESTNAVVARSPKASRGSLAMG